MKKAFLFLSIVAICLVFGCANAQKPSPNKGTGSAKAQQSSPNKKVLVAYFSRTGNTREIANQIHQLVGGEIFEIQTLIPYPEDYEEMVKKATEERESGYKPPLKSKVQDIRSYDVIFIGFPIWGMALPSPIRSFLSDYDLSGKTIVPFCTHGGYGKGSSFDSLKELSPQSIILEGFAFEGKRAGNAQPEVRKWLQEIKLIEK